MQFKIFDILSNLIPGFVVTIVITILVLGSIDLSSANIQMDFAKSFSSLITTIFLVTSFLTGYFIHMIGSRIESLLWWSWRGRPSKIVLKREAGKLNLSKNETNRILLFLIEKCENISLAKKGVDDYTDEDLKEIFQTAKHIANLKAKDSLKERLTAFSGSYIFSRNILVAFLIVLFSIISFMILKNYSFHFIPIGILGLVLMSWSRCKERAIYYSREVLTTSFYTSK